MESFLVLLSFYPAVCRRLISKLCLYLLSVFQPVLV